MYGYMGGYPPYGPMGGPGYGVDVNGDGVADYRVNPGVGIDVDGDGIADFRIGPTVTPGPGLGYNFNYGYPRPPFGVGPMPPMYGGYYGPRW